MLELLNTVLTKKQIFDMFNKISEVKEEPVVMSDYDVDVVFNGTANTTIIVYINELDVIVEQHLFHLNSNKMIHISPEV